MSARQTAFADQVQFEAACHRPGDFPGLCSVERIEAGNARLREKAQACRNRAAVAQMQTEVEPEVLAALDEVS